MELDIPQQITWICRLCLDKILGLGIYAFGQLYTIIPLEIFAFDLEAGIYGLNTSKG